MDALAAILGSVHLRSSLLVRIDAAGDWAFDTAGAPGGITTYCVLSGGYWLISGEEDDAIRLEAGDIMMLPQWREHKLCSSPEIAPIPVAEVGRRSGVKIWDPKEPLGEMYTLQHYAGPHEDNKASMLVLLMRAEEREEALLTNCMPSVWHFSPDSERIKSSVSLTVQFLTQELEQRSVGYSAASHRLAEFMFVQLLREIIDSKAEGVLGWLKGLSSPALSRVLMALHRMPERRWTIAELAELARMSRSAFCAEFSQEIGESPIAYARNLRMHAAAKSLEQGASVKQAAAVAGYSKSYGFHKAFHQAFGASPSSWRRR